jgi:NAD(P) transhydrogenase subunit beta
VSQIVPILYLVSAVLFILGLKGLTKVRSARRGNAISALAMLLAIVATLIDMGLVSYQWIILGLVVGSAIGAIIAIRVPMTSMPEMVALLNGSGGGASAVVAASIIWFEVIERHESSGTVASMLDGGSASAFTVVLSLLIGALTLTGSLVAWAKLKGVVSGQPILLPGRHVINALLLAGSLGLGFWMAFVATDVSMMSAATLIIIGAALILGIMLVIPIGGADMPVVISLLNSYSGVAAAMTGFVLQNNVLIISGALVGASGLILTQIMCVAMNRTLANVLFGGFGMQPTAGAGSSSEYKNVRSYSAEEAAMVLDAAEKVCVVPGYGLAVAQAQHVTREMADMLQKRGAEVFYAIHPVAGRMPGHMNVLLAEADVPYEQLIEMDAANPEFKTTDAVLVLGANDVVNPASENDPTSPIYGMPILDVFNAQTVMVVKRSLSPGFAGIKNELFEYDNTMMVFGDAKKVLQEIVNELKESA